MRLVDTSSLTELELVTSVLETEFGTSSSAGIVRMARNVSPDLVMENKSRLSRRGQTLKGRGSEVGWWEDASFHASKQNKPRRRGKEMIAIR
jgi:hypothetical protein